MSYRSYEWRIVFCLVALLLLVQLIAYFMLSASNERIARNTLSNEMQQGAQVFQHLLIMRQQQLELASEVLAKDYGLRDTIATKDKATIETVLQNHGGRVGADIVVLKDMQQHTVATSPASLPDFISSSTMPDGRLQFALMQHRENKTLFQLTRTRVLVPHPVAVLEMGFTIDQAFAAELRQLTQLDFIFLSYNSGEQWQLYANTLDTVPDAAQLRQLRQVAKPTLIHNKTPWLMQWLPLATVGEHHIGVMVATSWTQAMQPFWLSEQHLLWLIGLSVLLSTAVVIHIIRRMVAPLNRLAHLDTLTGLANRRLFELNMARSEQDLQRSGTPFAILMLDLDHFKQINDRHGHAAGDKLLIETAQRLNQTLRKSDTIARYGGDEFAVLLTNSNRTEAELVIAKLQQAFARPLQLGDEVFKIDSSIGMAVAPEHASDGSSLLRLADQAMYHSKKRHKGTVATPPKH